MKNNNLKAKERVELINREMNTREASIFFSQLISMISNNEKLAQWSNYENNHEAASKLKQSIMDSESLKSMVKLANELGSKVRVSGEIKVELVK